jgi:DNA-binding NtrC family response regulator
MRVLQERNVVPLGGTRAIPVDLRIVCATHRNLRAMIEAGTFREDLYYRINGLVLTLPTLRERTDLRALVTRILELQADGERLPRRVSAEVLEQFAQCRWPGNLRQLANVLRTASIMAEGAEQIELDDLPEDFLQDCVDIAAEPRVKSLAALAGSESCDEVRAAAQAQAAGVQQDGGMAGHADRANARTARRQCVSGGTRAGIGAQYGVPLFATQRHDSLKMQRVKCGAIRHRFTRCPTLPARLSFASSRSATPSKRPIR